MKKCVYSPFCNKHHIIICVCGIFIAIVVYISLGNCLGLEVGESTVREESNKDWPKRWVFNDGSRHSLLAGPTSYILLIFHIYTYKSIYCEKLNSGALWDSNQAHLTSTFLPGTNTHSPWSPLLSHLTHTHIIYICIHTYMERDWQRGNSPHEPKAIGGEMHCIIKPYNIMCAIIIFT